MGTEQADEDGGVDSGAAPQLVAVCGLPGVGKTTVAELIADRIGGRLVRSDVVRKEILVEPRYSEAETELVYEAALERARETIADGRPAVVDATFRERDYRIRALEVAEELSVPFRLVHVTCDEDVVRRRIRERTGDASDADFEVHQMFRESFDRVALEHVTVDNSGPREETRRQVTVHF